MEATFVDLRRKLSQVLKALDRNETVTVTYRGKKKAVMYPMGAPKEEMDIAKHPAVGMWADREDMKDVHAYLRKLRGRRRRAV